MVEINGMYILDYPDLITTKAITEVGRENIRKLTEMMREFNEEYNVVAVFPEQNTESL